MSTPKWHTDRARRLRDRQQRNTDNVTSLSVRYTNQSGVVEATLDDEEAVKRMFDYVIEKGLEQAKLLGFDLGALDDQGDQGDEPGPTMDEWREVAGAARDRLRASAGERLDRIEPNASGGAGGPEGGESSASDGKARTRLVWLSAEPGGILHAYRAENVEAGEAPPLCSGERVCDDIKATPNLCPMCHYLASELAAQESPFL